MSSTKSGLESQADHSLWFFESLSKKLRNTKSGDRTSEQKSIAGSFELPMYKVLMKMSLRGVLIVDFEISFTTGLITVQSI